MSHELVIVVWRDAWFDIDGGIEHDDYVVRTAGWLVDEGPVFLTVASEQTPDGDRAVTHVPRAMVQQVIEVEEP